MDNPVVVIGAGFAGLACAFHIAEGGVPVIILEKKEKLGGYFPELKRQFPTNTCGVCFMHPEYPAYCPYIEAERHPNITSFTNVNIENIEVFDEKVIVSFKTPNSFKQIEAQSVVIATGYEPFDISKKPELGGGIYENVYAALSFENFLYDLMAEGKELPYKKIAYVQCVGSRDLKVRKPYCSSFCCMYAIKQALLIKDFYPDVDVKIFFMDIRAFGKEYERYFREAINKGINFVRSAVATVRKRPSTGKLEVLYTKNGNVFEDTFDAVVLSQGASFDEQMVNLMKKLNINFDIYSSQPFDNREIKKNVYITGALFEPMDIPDSVIDGISTASLILSRYVIKPSIQEPSKIKQQKATKIGIFSYDLDYSTDDTLRQYFPEAIKVKDSSELGFAIKEHGFDGAIIVTNDIRKKESIIKSNNYFGLHINSVALIPSNNNALIEEIKSAQLRMKQVQRVNIHYKKLNNRVCIVGGGLAGLVSAKQLSKIGVNIVLIEKDEQLGGRLKDLPSRQELVKSYIEFVKNAENIETFTKTELKSVQGRFGEYLIEIESDEEKRKLKVDVILIATGAQPRKNVYSYEDGKKIFTFFDFEKRIEEIINSNCIVFIQCAGSRTDDNPICYRVCCKKAILNAIELKRKKPSLQIFILHKDVRTYGYSENIYREARALGVHFIRFSSEPEVSKNNNIINIKIIEEGTGTLFDLKPDYVILSTGVNPNTDDIKKLFDLNTVDGFLTPYNKKTGILEIKNGIYATGLCLTPLYTDDVIKQAEAVSIRIALKVLKREFTVRFNTAFVNKKYCCGCELCVKACPVSARYIDIDEKIAKVDDVLCEGCGTCAMVCANKASQHKFYEHKGMLKTIDLMLGT